MYLRFSLYGFTLQTVDLEMAELEFVFTISLNGTAVTFSPISSHLKSRPMITLILTLSIAINHGIYSKPAVINRSNKKVKIL